MRYPIKISKNLNPTPKMDIKKQEILLLPAF
jgi:hypothetical protein